MSDHSKRNKKKGEETPRADEASAAPESKAAGESVETSSAEVDPPKESSLAARVAAAEAAAVKPDEPKKADMFIAPRTARLGDKAPLPEPAKEAAKSEEPKKSYFAPPTAHMGSKAPLLEPAKEPVAKAAEPASAPEAAKISEPVKPPEPVAKTPEPVAKAPEPAAKAPEAPKVTEPVKAPEPVAASVASPAAPKASPVAAGHGHDSHDSHGGGHAAADHEKKHASLRTYLSLAVYLAVITAVEIAIVVMAPAHSDPVFTRGILFALSIAKFAGVVMFFMHLFFDNFVFTFLFGAGMLMALGTIFALMNLVPAQAIAPPPQMPGETKVLTTEGHQGNPANGPELMTRFNCVKCHAVPDVSAPEMEMAPDLNGLADRAATRKPGYSADKYIRESVTTPGAFVVEGYQDIMPPLRSQMSDQDYEDIVAYLLTLHPKK